MAGIVILCSGQGKQDVGMFEALKIYPEAQEMLELIRDANVLPIGIDQPELWFHNDIAQPLICLYQMMLWAVVKPLLPVPEIIAGYSLGEVSAYGISGWLDPVETVRLAAKRGKLMAAAAIMTPQTMIAVIGLKKDVISGLCATIGGSIAIINAVDHFIIGMKVEQVETFMTAAHKNGATRVVQLPVSVASHTALMDTAAIAFADELTNTTFSGSGSTVLAGISGEKVFTRAQAVKALTGQIHQTIDWHICLETAFSYGNRIFLELGPGHGLSRMALEAFPETEARSLSEFRDLYAVKKWVDAVSAREY